MESDKLDAIVKSMTEAINKEELSKKDILNVYANLGISIGCSMEGIKELPNIEVLEKEHYTNPTMGNALILQSLLLLHSWAKHG